MRIVSFQLGERPSSLFTRGRMMLYLAKCSQCGQKFRRRTRTELLSAIRKHVWKYHRAWMIKRIKAGRKDDNPGLVAILSAVLLGVEAVTAILRLAKRKRVEDVHSVVTVLTPVLPKNVVTVWTAAHRAHQIYKGGKRG
ncbi:hypothetical protein ES708_31632 [subsurface metagenome]